MFFLSSPSPVSFAPFFCLLLAVDDVDLLLDFVRHPVSNSMSVLLVQKNKMRHTSEKCQAQRRRKINFDVKKMGIKCGNVPAVKSYRCASLDFSNLHVIKLVVPTMLKNVTLSQFLTLSPILRVLCGVSHSDRVVSLCVCVALCSILFFLALPSSLCRWLMAYATHTNMLS